MGKHREAEIVARLFTQPNPPGTRKGIESGEDVIAQLTKAMLGRRKPQAHEIPIFETKRGLDRNDVGRAFDKCPFHRGIQCIHIRPDLPEGERLATVIHELTHAVFGATEKDASDFETAVAMKSRGKVFTLEKPISKRIRTHGR